MGGQRLWDKEEYQRIHGNKMKRRHKNIRNKVNLFEVYATLLLFAMLFIDLIFHLSLQLCSLQICGVSDTRAKQFKKY